MKVLIWGGEKLLTFIYGFQIYIHLIQTSNSYIEGTTFLN